MQLSFMLCIVDRRRSEAYVSLCRSLGLPLTLSMLGRGTAMRAHLDLYGLEATQKAVVATVADGQNARRLFREAKRQLYLDIPGNGIMLALPIKSVGGGKTLAYLTDNRPLEAQAPPAGFKHELLVMILNEGYIDEVMDAAREAGAAGGTVLHAKGTGARQAQKFFGVSLADEKEVLLIVAKSTEKAGIMRAVIRAYGPDTPAGTVTFSLPISEVAGLRLLEDEQNF